MKVKDVMDTSPLWVEDSTSVKKLARLVFTTNVTAFPVLNKDKKVVGFITQEDIFLDLYRITASKVSKLTPKQLINKSVGEVMVKKVKTIGPDTDLIKAVEIMYENLFANLPVVDENNELIGMVKHSDLFRNFLTEEIPGLESDQYSSFIAENYDQMVDWEKRFEYEFPTLFRVFAKNNVEKVLELGTWTGEYAIELARNGVKMVGLDDNPTMINVANAKREKMSEKVKSRLSFKLGDFKNINKLFTKGSFDGVICVGGVLPYFPGNLDDILLAVQHVIKENGVFVLQLLNLERIVEEKERFLYFKINNKGSNSNREDLYIEFFDKKTEQTLIHNIINFSSSEQRWIYGGINSIEIKYLKNNEIVPLLKRAGFNEILVSGNKGEFRGVYGQMSLVKPFDPVTSDWMTVIAQK